MTDRPASLRLAEEAINRVLWLDPETLAHLGSFEGRRIRLRLADPQGVPFELDVLPSEAGLRLEPVAPDCEPSVAIAGTPAVFARLLFGEVGPGSAAELHIRGDIELGNRFRGVLERIDIDWEEHLSRVTGDVVAHAIGRAARTARDWGRKAFSTAVLDAREYLQEEARVAPRREQVERFLAGVDRLRTDADRLEQRIARLRAHPP